MSLFSIKKWCLSVLSSVLFAFFVSNNAALAMYQGNPAESTLVDVIACLITFQNPGVTLTSEQVATGVTGVLGTTVNPASFNPLASVDNCDFISDGQTGISLSDVIALLIAFQNPGVVLTSNQLVQGINGVLGGTLVPGQVNAVPPAFPVVLPPVTLVAAIPTGTFVSTAAIAVLDPGFTLTQFAVPIEDPTNSLTSDFVTFGLRTVLGNTVRYQVTGLNANNLPAFVAPFKIGLTSLTIPGAASLCVKIYGPASAAPDQATITYASSTACP